MSRQDPRHMSLISQIPGGFTSGVATLLAAGFVLFGDYPVIALPAIASLIFAVYVGFRILVWFENARFSPKRLRVGVTWALVGIDMETDEYDTGPVRMYFALLALLLLGMVVRPFAIWVLS